MLFLAEWLSASGTSPPHLGVKVLEGEIETKGSELHILTFLEA